MIDNDFDTPCAWIWNVFLSKEIPSDICTPASAGFKALCIFGCLGCR